MKLAMSNIAWASEERLAAYGILAGAGFTGLEIAPGLFFHGAQDPFVPDEPSAREALAEMRYAGLTLVSMQSLLFGVTGAALFEGEEARARFESGMIRAIELAGRFGIPNLVFGSPLQRKVPQDLAMERALEESAEVFTRLGDRAAAQGTCLAIEANPAAYGTNFLNTFDEAAAFAARVDHPAIRVILDIGAMHMNEDFDAVPTQIAAHRAMLSHVHVSEPHLAPAPALGRDLSSVFDALEIAGYDRAISIEMKRSERGLYDVREAVERLSQAYAGRELCNG